MPSKRLPFRALALPVIAASLCLPLRAADAAELGEVKVNSHIGQQLSADIELVDLTATDLAELQARLASPEVFKVAGLRVPPELAGLYISVARRENRRFLHLTTLQPVQAEALHLFLELNSGGRQVIRAASLWLTPEPPAQRTVRPPAMQAAAPLPPSPAVAPVPDGESGLSEAARRAFEHRKQVAQAQADGAAQSGGAPAAVAPRTAASAPSVNAPAANDKRPAALAAATAAAPSAGAARLSPGPAAVAAAVPGVRAARSATSSSAPHAAVQASAPAASAASAAACAPAKQVEAQIQQCQAMTSKLADMEGKVARLQAALATPAPAAAAPLATKPAPTASKPEAAPPRSSSAPSKPGATPVKPGVAADLAGGSSRRLMMIGAGVLAGLVALGSLLLFLRRRRALGKGPLKIWQSFRKKGPADDGVPTLEDAVEVAAQ